MKKFLFFFLILITIGAFHISASASSIQKSALWPAISDIKPTNDGGYTFYINVRAYCPEGLEGNLLVAAYNDNNKLLDVAHRTVSLSFSEHPLDNCDLDTFLKKTDLAKGIEIKLKEKDNVIIKAFVISLDTLKPEKIESGKITFDYNGANSCVTVDYTLKSDYTDVQIEEPSSYYYYYYYDGKYDRLKISFDGECEFAFFDTFYFIYHNNITFENETGRYFNDELKDKTITCTEIPGIKIVNYLSTVKDEANDYKYYYLTKKGFSTKGIKVYCDFSGLK